MHLLGVLNIDMYFSYLTLPPIPSDFFQLCLENTKYIDKDPRLDSINNYRGPMNRATFLPRAVSNWLVKNIVEQVYPNDIPNELKSTLLNVTTYQKLWKNEDTWGTHPKHVDVGRNWALNYYFDTGGNNTSIRWYNEDTVVAETLSIESNRWCLLKVNQHHDVRGIEEGKIRYFITMNIVSENIDNFKSVIDQSTVI
jgi:hypothetical protein